MKTDDENVGKNTNSENTNKNGRSERKIFKELKKASERRARKAAEGLRNYSEDARDIPI